MIVHPIRSITICPHALEDSDQGELAIFHYAPEATFERVYEFIHGLVVRLDLPPLEAGGTDARLTGSKERRDMKVHYAGLTVEERSSFLAIVRTVAKENSIRLN